MYSCQNEFSLRPGDHQLPCMKLLPAGVKIELTGTRYLLPEGGDSGMSAKTFTVRSIVGELSGTQPYFLFLKTAESTEVYMGSADWMPRNLDRRVEIVFPVEDEKIKKELEHVLDLEFRDNVKAHLLQPDGTYVKPDKRGKTQINSQMEFCVEATEKAKKQKKAEKNHSRVFIPAEPVKDPEE